MKGNTETVTTQIKSMLEQNPLLTAKKLCILAGLDYTHYGNYVNKVKSLWKYYHENRRGPNCPVDVHCWRGFGYVPLGVEVALPLEGWQATRARNHMLVFKNWLGRLELFGTGRVNLYVRKPASLGKAYQLFCDGFFKNGAISDVKVLEACLKGIRFKSAHFVFETKQRLPQLTIRLFDESNGVTVKVGDRSHPNSVEVVAGFMDWAERLERKFDGLFEDRERVRPELSKGSDYVS
jgi:hypothetical protein